ncbi:hypothetical protein IBX73_06685 [candidate division WOR-3 bacterium]|nr:hypothetical protein [candidate division WOR-3 bacterium]
MMKKSPQEQELERMLKSSKFSSCGFLGTDRRNLWEVIEEDAAEIAKAGLTMEELAGRMNEITAAGAEGLGDWVQFSPRLRVIVDDNRGIIPCPWPHQVRCLKRITTVHAVDTGAQIRWSDLNIHLIKEHGFFEGRGSPFRIEPRMLVDTIFAHHQTKPEH